MSQILDFLTKWWPMLLAIGGFTTLANRISDKMIAPRWPRVAAVISAVSVDYWLVIREIASFFGLPTEASQKAGAIKAAKAAAKSGIVLLALFVCGCASFLHFSDPGTQAVSCSVTTALLPELEALASLTGIPLSVVEALYSDACTEAASRGLSQHDAEQAGLAAAKRAATMLTNFGARFDSMDGGKR